MMARDHRGKTPGRRLSPHPGRQESTRGVMIVDDNASIREDLALLLREEGYEAIAVANGLEALERLRWGLKPCLILLDLRMTVMTGWEFRAAQKEDPALAVIPVVAMTTGRWKPQDVTDFAECMPKPIDLDQLKSILLRYCGESRTQPKPGHIQQGRSDDD